MAFLAPKFANDVFISYARVDNQPAPGTDKGWVDLFKATLEIELSKLVGRAGVIRIWMDTRNLDGSHFFDEEIEKQVGQSAVFLALTSRGYLHPDSYCLRELDLFYRRAQTPPGSLKVGTRSRLFNARLYNVPPGEWPREFAGVSGACLFDTRRSEFGDPSRFGGDPFETQVKELADEIFALLSEYKAALAPTPAPAPPPGDAPTVFLADTAEGLSELRASVVERLRQEKIRVARRMPPPYPPDHDREAAAEISSATLSVHLLGGSPGEKFIDESGKTFLQRQAELGLEHARSQFIWVPPSPLVEIAAVKPDGYRDFLTGLERGERARDGYTFARVSDSGVPDEIVSHVRRLTAPKPPAGAAAAAALLETHRRDQLHALELYPLLLNKSLQPYINPEEDDPRRNFERLRELVSEVSVLVIIFGEVTGDWVVERLNSCLQVAGTIEPPRLRLCGIYAPAGDDARRRSLPIFPGDIPIIYFTQPSRLVSALDWLAGGRRNEP